MELITGIALHYKFAGGALPRRKSPVGFTKADGLKRRTRRHHSSRLTGQPTHHDGRSLEDPDFGLAQWIPTGEQDNLAPTVTKGAGGHRHSALAHEQLRGQRADQRSTSFCRRVLYEMATGSAHLQTSGPQLIPSYSEHRYLAEFATGRSLRP
jgi:hypothetical protein